MVSVSEVVETINGKGWLLSGLYQKSEDVWCAMLCPIGGFTKVHVTGSDPVTVLEKAFKKIRKPITDRDWKNVRKNSVTSSSRVRIKRKQI